MSHLSVGGLPIPLPALPPERFGKAPREPDRTTVGAVGRSTPARRGRRELPSSWTIVAVLDRMEEVYEVLARLPMTNRPREYGNAMPTPIRESLALIDTFQLDASGELKVQQDEQNRVRRPATAAEIKRADEAMRWPGQYLSDKPEVAKAVQRGALWTVIGADQKKQCKKLGIRSRTFQRQKVHGLRIIAQGLIRDRVPVS